jgi:hypothetical protein
MLSWFGLIVLMGGCLTWLGGRVACVGGVSVDLAHVRVHQNDNNDFCTKRANISGQGTRAL